MKDRRIHAILPSNKYLNLLIGLIIILIVSVCSCSTNTFQRKIAGTWTTTASTGEEILMYFGEDSEYKMAYIYNDSVMGIVNGTYTIDSDNALDIKAETLTYAGETQSLSDDDERNFTGTVEMNEDGNQMYLIESTPGGGSTTLRRSDKSFESVVGTD